MFTSSGESRRFCPPFAGATIWSRLSIRPSRDGRIHAGINPTLSSGIDKTAG